MSKGTLSKWLSKALNWYKESKDVGAKSFTLIKLLLEPIDNHFESWPQNH
jgi:hypothetical protein